MSPRGGDTSLRALRIVADRLEAWLQGDELAFETLGECLEQAGLTQEDYQEALLTLRSLAGAAEVLGLEAAEAAPGRDSQRVLSTEERAALSPEAWSFLLALRRRGSLDPSQFEQVLDQLHGLGLRPVDVATAREIATRVALGVDDAGGDALTAQDHERAH